MFFLCMGKTGVIGQGTAPVLSPDDFSFLCLVGFSAGIAPLAGRSGIGISASDSGIPEISVGKTRKNLWREGN